MSLKETNFSKQLLIWVFLIIILLISLSLRIYYLYEISKEPWFKCPLYDPLYNHYWAKGIATGNWDLPATVNDPEIRYTPHGRPPGYPYILSLIYLAFGVNPIAPRVIQYFVGIINTLLLWWILKKYLRSNLVSLLGTLLFASYWGIIYFESLLSYPVYVIFLLLIWLILILRWQEKNTHPTYLCTSGIVLGLIILFRPNAIFLASLYYIIILSQKRSKYLKNLLTTSLILLISISLPLIPCFIRNYIVARDFVFVSSYGGLNFYVGNHPESNGAEPRIPELNKLIGISEWSCFDYPVIVRGIAKEIGKDSISFSEANKYFYKMAINNIISNPEKWLKLTIRKILLFWGPVEITNDTVPKFDKENSRLLSKLPGFSLYSSIFIASISYILFRHIFGLNGSYKTPPLIRVSILITLLYFLSVLPFFVAGRYRIPIIPFIVIVDTWFISEVWKSLSERKIYQLLFQSGLLVASILVANTNFSNYQPSKSIWHFRQGTSALLCEDYSRAVEEFKASLEYDPENVFAKINYAVTLGKIGRPTEGIYVLTNNFQKPLSSPEELNAMGYLFEQIGDIQKSQLFYAKAIVSNFNYTLAHSNLSRIFIRKNEYIEAKKHLEIVASHQPHNFYINFQLAKIYELLSDYESAIKHYKLCLDINPNSEICWNNLGWIYNTLGDYASAINAYNRSIQANTKYPLPYINLANLYINLNNLSKAEEFLKKLLLVDPYNCEAIVLLSNVYLFNQQIEKSYTTLVDGLSYCEDYPKLQNNLGAIQWRYYGHPHALVLWLNSITIDPNMIEAYVNLADFYELEEDCETAIEYLLMGLIKTNDSSLIPILNGFICDKNNSQIEN